MFLLVNLRSQHMLSIGLPGGTGVKFNGMGLTGPPGGRGAGA